MFAALVFKLIEFERCRGLLTSPCMVAVTFAIAIFGSRLLRTKPLLFMGDVSYSTYLLHTGITLFVAYYGSSLVSSIPHMLAYVAVTYILAALVYRFYEVPMRRKIRAAFA